MCSQIFKYGVLFCCFDLPQTFLLLILIGYNLISIIRVNCLHSNFITECLAYYNRIGKLRLHPEYVNWP